MTPPSEETEMGGSRSQFEPTYWTVVLEAKDLSSPHRRQSLERLIHSYWKPLYFFVRRRGKDPESSKDLVQGFFTALLDRNYLQYVQRGRGKFRSFLLTALEHYLADDVDRNRAQKRGGGQTPLSLDFADAERRLERTLGAGEPPDLQFRREWACRVMAQALESLREEYVAAGRRAEFEAIRLHLSEGSRGASSYAQIAAGLNVSENDVRRSIHRARERYREAILRVLRSTSRSEDDAREELVDLFSAFS